MDEERNLVERGGGYVVLLIVTAVLFFGWRTGLVGGLGETEGQTAVTTPPSLATDSFTAANAADQQPAFDFATGDLPVISDGSLDPNPNPHTFQGERPAHAFQTYVVKRGDTPNGIAERFGIKTETLLGGNPHLSQEASLLQTDMELIILPIDGVLHDVQPGDTLEGIAEEYDVRVEDIIAYADNHLEFPYRLYPETQVMVPGAVREVFVWTPPDLASVGGTSREGSSIKPLIVGTGTFQYPVGGRNFSQFYWYGHPAIDIALGEGSSVVAADTGTVTYAGWNVYGYGNLVVINHGNGFETFYGHLSAISVTPGQIVYKGNVIGLSGNTGNSSGPHIHFEIRVNGVQDNPCWYLGCG
ncbi:MAG: M23 family metallopeptidase [Chloroflexi bacterium]|nr:M23 family metallopeptidase [Chloroflexota bacterium]MBP7043634.1 M23 family metallopeptidase [Chloroflexota bacterium]